MALRIILATIVLAGSLAGAVYLAGYKHDVAINPKSSNPTILSLEPSWADPAAVALAIVGVGGAAAILATRRRN